MYFGLVWLFGSSINAKEYIVAIPQATLSTEFKAHAAAGFLELLQSWKKDDRLIVLNSETGAVLCDLVFSQNGPRKHIKDMNRQSCGVATLLSNATGTDNLVNLPQIIAHLDAYNYDQPELVIFGSPIFKDPKNGLDFSNGFPSDAHVTKKFGYHITPFNRAHIKRALTGNFHWIYFDPKDNIFVNQKHVQGVLRFYALYLNSSGLRLITFSKHARDARKANIANSPEIAIPDLENKDIRIIRFHSLQSVKAVQVAAQRFTWQPVSVSSLSSYHDTQSTYKFPIGKKTRSIKIEEFDGDDNGTTLVVVIGITANDKSKTLGSFIPSGNNVSKISHITFPEVFLKEVILYPVNRSAFLKKNEFQENKLGGMWTINSLSFETK